METIAQEALFGQRLRRRRKVCKLSQVALAKAIGEPQNYISRWESGHIQYMTLERLRRLARSLRTSTDYLLGLSDEIERGFPGDPSE